MQIYELFFILHSLLSAFICTICVYIVSERKLTIFELSVSFVVKSLFCHPTFANYKKGLNLNNNQTEERKDKD